MADVSTTLQSATIEATVIRADGTREPAQLKKNYAGKTYSEHAMKALGGIAVSQVAGMGITLTGHPIAAMYVSHYGSLASIGIGIGNAVNQYEYNRKYGNE